MNDTTPDTARVFAPLWKRKWIILAVGIAVGVATYFYYKHQPPSYLAKTSLYLGGTSEQGQSTGANPSKALSGREIANQVELINSSIVGGPVHRKLRAEGNLQAVKARAKATASPTASFIIITTEARTPRAAQDLANTYALVYTARQKSNYLRNVRAQLANTRQQLRRIEVPTANSKKGQSASSAIQQATLASKINQLESQLANFVGVQQVSPAKANPLPLSPKPKKSAIFGFVLGLLLAAVGAYVFSLFDRRLGSLSDVEGMFQAQVLTALPKVRSPTRRPNGERAPARPLLEPLRRLHTTLQLGDGLPRNGHPRSIVFVSADPGDGRSTLIANLARVQRDAGARVAVIEADMRRPVLGRLLDVESPHGLGDVLMGRAALDEAMRDVAAPGPETVGGTDTARAGGLSTVVAQRGTGSLSALLAGESIDNPPALLASVQMADLLRAVSDVYEFVLVDAPPPLSVSDVMPLLSLVDGVIVVARVGHTGTQAAQRLVQVLGRTASAPLLGVVANCVAPKDLERYGFSPAPAPRRGRKLSRR
ncbi:MAG TPA: Wzz/FepE/Etk N-terminal domain-containing protein [Solirubrobacteraceae bacterium]|nr:Wzz/FepE/Etk N-terminal domain-containing protein [Solirubrobacteraceae bacterium]